MSIPRLYKTEAIVLKQTPIGEADRILTLYTPDMGKLRAVARGARRPKSKLGGHVEVLSHLRLSLAQGRSLDVVTQADTIHSFRRIREDLGTLSQALYLVDLVGNFTPEESSNHPLYQLLLNALGWLEESNQHGLLLRYFEMRLLHHTGYRPEVYYCVQCRAELKPKDHLFSPSLGGIICPDCLTLSESTVVPVSLDALKVVRFLQREEYTRAIHVRVSSAIIKEVERVMRHYIHYLLEREVKSVSFMGLVASGSS